MKKLILSLIFIYLLVINITIAQTGVTAFTLPVSIPRGIKIDNSNNKWIWTANQGIAKFDGISFTTYTTANSGIVSNKINHIAFEGSNTWFASNQGISKFDGTNWVTINMSNSGLPNDTVNYLFYANTTMWIGTKNGLASYDGSIWTVYNTSNSGLTNNNITSIGVNSINGDVWVGTNSGLFLKNSSGWLRFDENNSFIYGKINEIYIDGNDVYVSSNIDLHVWNGFEFLSCSSQFIGVESFVGFGFSSKSITKGPQNGIFTNTLYEITSNRLHKYNIATNPIYHSYESGTNLIWYVVGSNTLASFNYANYTQNSLLNYMKGFNTLDVNKVRAAILNRGDMHWTGQSQGYEVPKNSNKHSVFCTNFWIGGKDNGGTLHQSAMTYRQIGYDYLPGPLDTIAGETDSLTSEAFNRIWKIDRLKIEEFQSMFANGSVQNGSYAVDTTILNWPAHGSGNYSRNLAPFVDVNGDGLYNPLIDGDYPKIKGDQMCFWIFNDNMPHGETGGLPLKVEIHASAYAYACPNYTNTDSFNVINYTTLYNFKIFNRGGDNFQDTYLGLFQDVDLGNAYDDYIGCNPANNYAFVYNGDLVDDNPPAGQIFYGKNPPMQSTVVLSGPTAETNDGIDNNNNGTIDEIGEKNLMTSFLYFNNNGSVMGNPSGNPANYYNYTKSTWLDNTHVTYGGNGYGGAIPYDFMYDGVPLVSGWDELSSGNIPSDRRYVMGCGPFKINSGQSVDFDFALVFTRDTTLYTYSIQNLYQKNKQDVLKIKQWFDFNAFPSCLDTTNGINNIITQDLFLIYPNPASTELFVEHKTLSKNSIIEIYNIMGQKIKELKLENENTKIDVSDFASGLYIVKINDGKKSLTQRFIKQ